MKKSKLLQKTAVKLADASFKEGNILENQVIKSIRVLKSLPTPDAIWTLSQYLNELKRKEREFTMLIETAIPLSPTQIKNAKKIVEKKQKITKVLVRVNPNLLGGFSLKIGDKIWDESILAKINQVKEAIISGRSN